MLFNHNIMAKSIICVSYSWLMSSSVSLSLCLGFCHFLGSLSTSCLNLSYLLCLPHFLVSLLPSSLLPPPRPPSFLSSHPPHPPPPGRSGLAASYLSVKALVPQMPKLLKSLFPARDDKKELRPSPHNQQVSKDGVVQLRAVQSDQFFI